MSYCKDLKSDFYLQKIVFICFNDSPLKIMKNAFYVIVKVLFVLKIFKFLSWLFGHLDNHFHNILRLFDVLPNFLFTTSETMRNYYLPTGYTLEFYIELPNSLAASHRTKMKSKIMQKMRQGDEPQTPPAPQRDQPQTHPQKGPTQGNGPAPPHPNRPQISTQ